MITSLTMLTAMLMITVWCAPELPISRSIVSQVSGILDFIRRKATFGRGLIAVSFALALFAVIWALQGDAPMFLAMLLPELAGWFATFEIATLVDAMLGVGAVLAAARAVGVQRYLIARFRTRRRRVRRRTDQTNNDDDRSPAFASTWVLVA